jgi:large repetitive protein
VINPSGLCPGTYSVTVTDAIGCIAGFTAPAITEPTALVATSTVADANCGLCDGQANVSVSGGAGSYTFVWSNAQTDSTATNLCSGVYMVDITDAAGCVMQQSVAVSNSNAPSISVTPTDVVCGSSACSGAATASVSGGLPPYTINWVPGGQAGSSINGLCAGTYFVQAQDANNCIATQSFTITATTAVSLTQGSIQPQCGVCDGQLSVTPSGGTAPYTYNWSTGSSNDTITGLCAGLYTVTVNDSAGCSSQQVFALSNSGGPQLTLTVDSANCNGSSDGSASVSVSGGTSPYTFSWNGIAGTNSVSGLAGGSNVLTVTDAAGCISSVSFTVEEPSPVSLSLNSTVLPNCAVVCNGSISAIPSGGTLPYTFVWSSGGSGSTISSLCAGTYSVIVMDANNCSALQNTILNNNPNLISGNPVIVDPACGACNGTITLAPSGGITPYSFSWTTGDTASSITSVCAGVYQVNITDSFGCTTPVYVNISNTGGPTVTVSATAETCFGLGDGTATAVADTGSGPYQYFWVTGGQTTTIITGQQAGSYTVQVQDVNNCVTTTPVTIPAAAQIQANPLITTPSCGASNGAITISPTGGSGSGYTYNWGGGLGTSATVTNLSAGVYTVDVTDGAGCIQQIIIPVSNGTIPLISVASDSVLCNGTATGTATVSINGGSGAYTVTWSTGATATSISSLAAGSNYWVTVVDDTTGCSTSTLFNIEEPDTLSLSLNNQQQPTCGLANNGALTAISSGGTMPYTYLWSPGSQTSASIANLSSGSFTVEVTDANGCTRSQTTVLNNASTIASLNPAITGPTCGQCDGSIALNPTAANFPLTYIWSNGDTTQSISNVCAGVYQVLVTDSIGCQQTFNLPISNSSGIAFDGQAIVNETCSNSCDGSVTVSHVGGTLPYSYTWMGLPDTTNTLTNLCAGTYFLQTTDANGCIFTSQVSITSPSQLLVTPIVSSPNCATSTGAISLQVSGGTAPYTYSWQPGGSTASSLSNIPAGNYQVTINDAAGCSQLFVFSISSVGAPTISASQTDVSCTGSCDGAIGITLAGGTSPFSYAWSTGATTDSITGLCDTTVSVVVTDNNGCIAAGNYTIAEPLPIQFSIPVLNTPLCFGDTNGVINTVPSGGTLGYTFSWNPAVAGNTTTATGLAPGVYVVTITDANGCTATESDTLTQPAPLLVTGVVTDASCNTVPDGAINLTVSGGTPAYDYNWSSGDSIEDLINILAGNYTVIVSDTNACADTLNFTVNATVFVTAATGNDTTMCYNPTFLLDASATTGEAGLTWYDGNGTPLGTTDTLTVSLNTGVNTFVVIAVNGACADTDTVVITNNALPLVDAGPYQTILVFNSVQIGGNPTATAGNTILWTPGTALTDSTISNPVASPTVTTTYTVSVTNSSGCTATDTVTVRVLPQVIFPNGFTPNGDGKNDTWIIDNISLFPECEVEVYNRWGEQLFYSKGYTTQWDGTYKGKPLPVGTYYYAIKLNHELFPEPYTGPITILR